MAYLKQRINGESTNLYELTNIAVTIGRHPDNHVVIEDQTVSAHHAKVEPKEQGYHLVDLGSTNGIRVKGDKIQSLTLQPGVVFAIGTHEFEFINEIPSDLEQTLKIKKSWIPGVYYTGK